MHLLYGPSNCFGCLEVNACLMPLAQRTEVGAEQLFNVN
jgi:hypothetical protein